METAAFQAEAFGKPLCISTSVPQICNMCNLSCCELWVKDFVCSQGCCSNSFFEAIKRKKKKQHWQKVQDLQLCKITPFLSPSLCPHTQLPNVPRLPDWARYPEFSPTLALRTEGQMKTSRQISYVSIADFPVLKQTFPLGKNKERKGQKEHKSSWLSF